MKLQDEDIYAVVREYLTDNGKDTGALRPDAELRELGIDSLGAVDLAFRFEDRFGIEIPLDGFPLTTVRAAAAYVAELSEKASAGTAAAD